MAPRLNPGLRHLLRRGNTPSGHAVLRGGKTSGGRLRVRLTCREYAVRLPILAGVTPTRPLTGARWWMFNANREARAVVVAERDVPPTLWDALNGGDL